jgi:hypothetical protein
MLVDLNNLSLRNYTPSFNFMSRRFAGITLNILYIFTMQLFFYSATIFIHCRQKNKYVKLL